MGSPGEHRLTELMTRTIRDQSDGTKSWNNRGTLNVENLREAEKVGMGKKDTTIARKSSFGMTPTNQTQ